MSDGPAVSSVSLALVDSAGRSRGEFRIRLTPRQRIDDTPSPLLDRRGEAEEAGVEAVQLLEGEEYRYEFSVDPASDSVRTDLP
jgi:hypothetical protein